MKGDTNDDGKLSLMEQWEAERNKKSSKLKSAMYIRKGEKQKSVKQWKEEFNARGWGAKKVEKAAGINRWIEVYAAKCFTRYLNNVKLPGEERRRREYQRQMFALGKAKFAPVYAAPNCRRRRSCWPIRPRRARRPRPNAIVPASRTRCGSRWISAAATMPNRAGCCR